MIEVFADKAELEKALAGLNELEARGFGASLAAFQLKVGTADNVECPDQYILKADPVDKSKNWGRITRKMIEWYQYRDGELLDEYNNKHGGET